MLSFNVRAVDENVTSRILYCDQAPSIRDNSCFVRYFTYYIEVCHEWTIYDAESEQPQLLLSGRGKLSEE